MLGLSLNISEVDPLFADCTLAELITDGGFPDDGFSEPSCSDPRASEPCTDDILSISDMVITCSLRTEDSDFAEPRSDWSALLASSSKETSNSCFKATLNKQH